MPGVRIVVWMGELIRGCPCSIFPSLPGIEGCPSQTCYGELGSPISDTPHALARRPKFLYVQRCFPSQTNMITPSENFQTESMLLFFSFKLLPMHTFLAGRLEIICIHTSIYRYVHVHTYIQRMPVFFPVGFLSVECFFGFFVAFFFFRMSPKANQKNFFFALVFSVCCCARRPSLSCLYL